MKIKRENWWMVYPKGTVVEKIEYFIGEIKCENCINSFAFYIIQLLYKNAIT